MRHEHQDTHNSKDALKIAILATGFIFVLEFAGAWWTNSLALLSDSVHVMMDLLSFILTLSAIHLAERPISDSRTFGWHRLEVFAAMVNGMTVSFAVVFIVFQALKRIAHPQAVLTFSMLEIAGLGLLANLFVVWKLSPFHKKDLNVKSAFLHAAGDAVASVAVIFGGLFIWWTKNPVADPVAAIAVAAIVFAGAFGIFRDGIHILLEGAPRGVETNLVVQLIEEVSGEDSVKDLHIWNLCSHICALSVHIRLPESRMSQQKKILEEINLSLERKFNIVHTTVQIESEHWR